MGRGRVIILDSISPAKDLCFFQTWNKCKHFLLHILGKASANAIAIIFAGGAPLGFEKNLMPVFVCKANNFIFNRRAVTRALRFDLSRVHRGTMQILADQIMHLRVGIGNMTGNLLLFDFLS